MSGGSDRAAGSERTSYEVAALLLFMSIFACFVVFLTGDVTDLGVQSVMAVSSVAGAILLSHLVRKARVMKMEENEETRR